MRHAIPILLLIAALTGIWWINQNRQSAPTEPVSDFVTVPEQRPEPRYPLPQAQPEPEPEPEPLTLLPPELVDSTLEPESPDPLPAEPLPSLIESDPAALASLNAMLGAEAAGRWVRPEWIISRAVVMVHSLDGAAPPVEFRPLTLLRGAPQVAVAGEEVPYWTEATTRRYAELVGLLESTAPAEASARYVRYYPLFQQAWEELGEPEPWFNDRLIDIIDHLLGAPSVELPIELVPWEGRLKFASEPLEAESWGRKLLIRLGPEQAGTVQNWLQAFRQELTAHGRQPRE